VDAPPTADEAATDPAGWYCFSLQPRLAEWDGVAWTGSTHATGSGPLLPGPPAPFAFVRQTWFRWMVIGQALVILPAILSGSSGQALWSWLSVVGYAAFLGGSVQLVGRVLHLDALDGRRSLTWIGIGSGVAAFIVGVGLEILADRGLGWAATLWLTGPIEEGGKLLVPFLLLVFGARRFKVPRVGLYLVLISGATVGVLEGAEYEARPDFPWAHLQMALLRPSAELLHVFVTGFAAAVIWLAAWRKGRAATGAGAVAFLIAMAIHSFHDGIITFFNVDPKSFNSTLAQTLHEALAKGLSGGLFALGLAAMAHANSHRQGTSRPARPPGDPRSSCGAATRPWCEPRKSRWHGPPTGRRVDTGGTGRQLDTGGTGRQTSTVPAPDTESPAMASPDTLPPRTTARQRHIRILQGVRAAWIRQSFPCHPRHPARRHSLSSPRPLWRLAPPFPRLVRRPCPAGSPSSPRPTYLAQRYPRPRLHRARLLSQIMPLADCRGSMDSPGWE